MKVVKEKKSRRSREIGLLTRDENTSFSLHHKIMDAWSKVAPFWPLKNLIAVNPIAGFERLRFEDALRESQAYFQQREIPDAMLRVNVESIKWLQVFFDEGQSTLSMPLREHGLLKSVLSLIRFDESVHQNDLIKRRWIEALPDDPKKIIAETLIYLGIPINAQEQFMILMLTTLPGWASFIQYRTTWADQCDRAHPHPVTQIEYLAFRLVLTCLIWPQAKALLTWHENNLEKSNITDVYHRLSNTENQYQKDLIKKLCFSKIPNDKPRPNAQLVFCIDVRSEPFRRAIEAQGHYETYGFAGFFGLPVLLEDRISGEGYASCPVLLKPQHHVMLMPDCSLQSCIKGRRKIDGIKKLYQSLKYTFTTPFSLVEWIGFFSGIWMLLKSFMPRVSNIMLSVLNKALIPSYKLIPNIESISIEQQVAYASNALKMMGLTDNFAPLVIFCGHGSTTENNAYATALDCGACGGHHGGGNAQILARILNDSAVRDALKIQNIIIPSDTFFLAGEHNTTTDEVEIENHIETGHVAKELKALNQDLENARVQNSLWRCTEMGLNVDAQNAKRKAVARSQDWAQVRPEWGLARNASFIIGPRRLTQSINLEGRAFLHSYDYEQDGDGALLKVILTAPMVVAQWINAQYLFSTLDNVAYGGGSKVTQNITGKIGVMQGNASDLMHGLPLQSVFKSDAIPYHEAMRLTVVVFSPKSRIDLVIHDEAILRRLFSNGWVHLICFDPSENQKYILTRDLEWLKLA